MKQSDLTALRLFTQQIVHGPCKTPGEVVHALGAMQAQDYPGALWAVGLRLLEATEADVEQAIRDKAIVRTWPMRGTLHLVAPGDVRWMLKLLTPRIVSGAAARHRQLELTPDIFARSRDLIGAALQGGQCLTRQEMCQVLERDGISTTGQRGIHIFWRLAQEGLICFGPQHGRQPTFVLLEDWIPGGGDLERDEALLELARRYFTGHGPATLKDFVWWSGLKISDARAGLALAGPHLERVAVDDQEYWIPRDRPPTGSIREVRSEPGHHDTEATPSRAGAPSLHLLPGFDEYMLGYTDRSAALEPQHAQKICPGNNGMFMPTLVIDGAICGTWKRAIKKGRVVVTPAPFRPLSGPELEALSMAAARYGRFLGVVGVVG